MWLCMLLLQARYYFFSHTISVFQHTCRKYKVTLHYNIQTNIFTVYMSHSTRKPTFIDPDQPKLDTTQANPDSFPMTPWNFLFQESLFYTSIICDTECVGPDYSAQIHYAESIVLVFCKNGSYIYYLECIHWD